MKSPILGLALSTVAFGASSIYLWSQLSAAQGQAAALDKANAALTARVAELQQRRDELVAQHLAAATDPAPPESHGQAPGPKPTEAPPPPPPDAGATFNVARAEARNAPQMPEAMLKMMRANMRAQNKRMYFDLQSKLGLTDEQTSDLLDLLTEQRTAGFKGPRNLDPAQAREYWEGEQAKQKAAIGELLGPGKALEFADYQKTLPARSELMMISQQLEGVDTPLTDTQRSRLLDALVAERERIPMPTYVEGTPQEEASKAYNDWQTDYEKRVADAARGILSSEQANTMNAYQQWQREMRQQFATQGPPGGPPVRMMRGNVGFVSAPSAGGIAFAVSSGIPSPDPTEKPAEAK